jgi:hypothetical protein
MFRPGLITRGACISAFVLLTAGPAFAGKEDRAQQAIAAAAAKIDAANKVGASGETPRTVARAQAMLAHAREDLKRGHKTEAFDEATQASELADTALGTSQQNKIQAERDQRTSAEVAASAAQQDAADANARAVDANARAANAEQSAAMAAADAAAVRATPPPVPVTTTVTTVNKSSHVVAAHRVVRRAPVKKRTTTVVRRATPATVASEESTTTVTTNASGQ